MATNNEEPLDPLWSWAAMAPELTDTEKKLRNLFVDEYLVDYDAVLAAQRCGYQHGFAKDYAERFMRETYVIQRIKFVEHAIKADDRKAEEYDKQSVIAVLRREMHNPMTTGSTRVQAAISMAKIRGMDKPAESENPSAAKGGVLMVPAIANLNDWEAVAMASQAKLVADART